MTRFFGRAASLALLAPVLLLAACAVTEKLNPLNWWSSGSQGPKPTPLADISATVPLKPAWKASLPGAGDGFFAPAVAGGLVFAAAADGTLAAFDARTGAQKWRIQAVRGGLSAGVGAADDTVVVANLRGEVFAFDFSGQAKWKTRVTSEVLAPPLVADGMVLARSNDMRVHALAATDGRKRWVYQRTAPALVLRNFGGLAVGRGTVFAGFPGGKLVALAAGNGSVRWEGTVALPRGATELERIADVTGSPVANERMVCAAAYQGRAACFDISGGQVLWTRDVSSQNGMTTDQRYAFVTDAQSAVLGLAAETGTSLWRQERLAHRGLSAPLSVGRVVVVGDYQGVVHALSREDGALVGRAATDGSWISSTPVVLEMEGREGLLVQTRGGGLFAFAF